MNKPKTKLLGVQVSQELHALAHMTARAQNKSLSEWLRNLIATNIDSRANTFFLARNALLNEHK